MHKTPKKIFEEIKQERPFCERQAIFHDHICKGNSTMEHVWKYRGRQIDEKWAIIRLCEWAHSVGPYHNKGGLDKRKNEYISLTHITDQDKNKYPRFNWNLIQQFLASKYINTFIVK